MPARVIAKRTIALIVMICATASITLICTPLDPPVDSVISGKYIATSFAAPSGRRPTGRNLMVCQDEVDVQSSSFSLEIAT